MRFGYSIAMLVIALMPGVAVAVEPAVPPAPNPTFGEMDKNRNGALSLEELVAVGWDDLAFRAIDINGDGSLSPDEYAKYQAEKKTPPGESGKPPK